MLYNTQQYNKIGVNNNYLNGYLNLMTGIFYGGVKIVKIKLTLIVSSFNIDTPSDTLVEYSTNMNHPFGRSKNVSGVPFTVFYFPL